MKICNTCHKELDELEFPVTSKGNLRGCCHECFRKKKYMWNKNYIEKIGGRSKKVCEFEDKFDVNPVPILESEYWGFIK